MVGKTVGTPWHSKTDKSHLENPPISLVQCWALWIRLRLYRTAKYFHRKGCANIFCTLLIEPQTAKLSYMSDEFIWNTNALKCTVALSLKTCWQKWRTHLQWLQTSHVYINTGTQRQSPLLDVNTHRGTWAIKETHYILVLVVIHILLWFLETRCPVAEYNFRGSLLNPIADWSSRFTEVKMPLLTNKLHTTLLS